MRPRNGLSPYPILAPYRDDFQGAQISADIDVQMNTELATLKVSINLDDLNLLELIQLGMANYAVHVECGPTSYRRLFLSQAPKFTEQIPSDLLASNFDVCTFVVAVRDFPNYKSARFHSDYTGYSFDIYRGNILAIGENVNVAITDENDGTPPSLIKIALGSERQEVNIQVNTDGDEYIVVSLEPALFNLYLQMGEGVYSDTVLSLILLPVLENVLSQMARDQSDEDKYWFQTIERLLEANGISLTDIADGSSKNSPLAVAQRLFEGPVLRSMRGLAQVEADDDEA